MALADGVTNCVFYIDSLLRELGCDTEIFSHRPPFEYRHQVKDIHRYQPGDCDLMLVHHSMGHDLVSWLARAGCPRVLIYHNITPAHYFPADSAHHFYANKGREQLAEWANEYVGAIGLSPQNSQELNEQGYRNVSTIPMLVDMARLAKPGTPPALDIPASARPRILSVGRLVENKRQHILIEAMAAMRDISVGEPEQPLLLLVGATTNPGYERLLRQSLAEHDLHAHVQLTGKLSDSALTGLYSHSDIYWCASEHEGFGMPLIEANFHGLPVVATAAPGLSDTLGQAGLVLEENDDSELAGAFAAATKALLQQPDLAATLRSAGQDNLQRFERGALLNQLGQYLDGLELNGRTTTRSTAT